MMATIVIAFAGTFPVLPDIGEIDQNSLKVILSDVGLVTAEVDN
jgi:hypothetical protein